MAKSLDQVKWVAKDGSIFAAESVDQYNPDFKVRYKVTPAVAFNVGDKLATHIVNLHNKALDEAQSQD